MDSREAERFEEGIEPEFQEEELQKVPGDKPDSGHVSGASHGGYGSSSLQECLDRLNQARNDTLAPCHSRVVNVESSNPPHWRLFSGVPFFPFLEPFPARLDSAVCSAFRLGGCLTGLGGGVPLLGPLLFSRGVVALRIFLAWFFYNLNLVCILWLDFCSCS